MSTNIMGSVNSNYIGAMCGDFRRYQLHLPQTKVASDCYVSRELVSKFENGQTSNAIIFLWYIKMGIFDWVSIDKWNGWS